MMHIICLLNILTEQLFIFGLYIKIVFLILKVKDIWNGSIICILNVFVFKHPL